MRKNNWKPYAIGILATEAVGALSGFLTREGVKIYNQQAVKPPITPPPVVFPIVWAILYALLGVGITRIYLTAPSKVRTEDIRLYLLQLAFNFLWSLIFFNLQAYGFAFFWLVILWGLIVWMTLTFREIDRPAAWLQIPYLIWVLFAGYLNYGTWILNR